MTTLFITLGVMLLVVTIMAIGVIVGRNPIAGSCGGMNQLGMMGECDICGGDQSICDEENERVARQLSPDDSRFLAYDAVKHSPKRD